MAPEHQGRRIWSELMAERCWTRDKRIECTCIGESVEGFRQHLAAVTEDHFLAPNKCKYPPQLRKKKISQKKRNTFGAQANS